MCGAVSADTRREVTRPTNPLYNLSHAELDARLAGDLRAVGIYREGLQSVIAFAGSRPDLFPAQKQQEARLLNREQKEAVWSAWKTFLDYVVALDSIGTYHRDFYRLRGGARTKSFQIGYAAFLAKYRFALEFIGRTDNDPGFDTVLNDPVSELGLSGGSFARLKFQYLHAGRASEFAAFEMIYQSSGNETGSPLRDGIESDRARIWQAGRGKGQVLTAKNALKVVQDTGFAAYFPVQTGVSEWMGDTKVYRKNRSLISAAQIAALVKKLEPGDVLLERREWYLSNVGLPGFWPHAALYIGTPDQRRAYFDEPEVKEWAKKLGAADGSFESYLAAKYIDAYTRSGEKQEHDHVPRVIEAISEGVAFTTIEHSADCDSLVVLRPRLPKREKAEAVLRAYHYAGRPYDFNFDFRTDSSLVCTELVYKAYEPSNGLTGLRFPMTEMLGRPVLPANEIVKQFDAQYGTEKQQFDFVTFLDGDEQSRRAVETDVAAFRESHKRPKWHVLVNEKERSRE